MYYLILIIFFYYFLFTKTFKNIKITCIAEIKFFSSLNKKKFYSSKHDNKQMNNLNTIKLKKFSKFQFQS